MKSIILLVGLVLSISSFAQSFKSFTDADGLPSNNVLCASSDQEGTMWFGTQSGIAIYDGSTWEVMTTTTHPGLANNNVSSILVTKEGNVWAAGDFGASFYNGTAWTTYKTVDGLGSSRVTNISEMKNGDIWFSDFNGATHYDGTVFIAYKAADGLPFGGTEDVLEADNGDIILATGLGGVAVFNGTDFEMVTEEDGLVSDNTTALLKDNDGNIWVGTSDGISVFDDTMKWMTNHTRMYTMPKPDTLNPVEDLAMDSEGNIWSGIYVDYLVTVGGVAKFDGNAWTDYDEEEGVVGPTIRAITVDEKDNIWVTTSSGISRIAFGTASLDRLVPKNVSVYPNPAENELHVNLGVVSEPVAIQLINSIGAVILERKGIVDNNVTLNISELQSGVYSLYVGGATRRVLVL
ncbi:T9SS type A sorting domain-containing protein [Bacteroidia bacterium]|jgi:ligand-binding sensor domain-containing protein|nr:T9SS type A sorting domain-containing protein [Bacteroidia bacterium]